MSSKRTIRIKILGDILSGSNNNRCGKPVNLHVTSKGHPNSQWSSWRMSDSSLFDLRCWRMDGEQKISMRHAYIIAPCTKSLDWKIDLAALAHGRLPHHRGNDEMSAAPRSRSIRYPSVAPQCQRPDTLERLVGSAGKVWELTRSLGILGKY